jgi:hypothetical protein
VGDFWGYDMGKSSASKAFSDLHTVGQSWELSVYALPLKSPVERMPGALTKDPKRGNEETRLAAGLCLP